MADAAAATTLTAPPPYLEVRGLSKRFGATDVLREVSFEVAKGEFVCFLGPSGCGKTTLLLCLAGLEQADRGRIVKQGASIEGLPPSQRDVGIVFQSYALFPNLTVFENIAFGLRSRRAPAAQVRTAVAGLLELLSLQGHEDKYPSQISGGQQQRVALARSLAVSPSLLLLDEPLSALDAQVRARLRGELRELQTRLGLTTIMVTHDQEEAQVVSDRIVLMNHGRVEQVGTPWEIYNRPASAFVADFIGEGNLHAGVARQDGVEVDGLLVPCRTTQVPGGGVQRILVRPEDLEVTMACGDTSFARVRVVQVEHLGPVVRVRFQASGGGRWIADVPKKAYARHAFAAGDECWIGVHPDDVRLIP